MSAWTLDNIAIVIIRCAMIAMLAPLVGCAAVATSAATTAATPVVVSAANQGPDVIHHDVNEFPPAGTDTGLVYFYRRPDKESARVNFHVEEDGRLIGILENGTYFYHHATLGRHHYRISPENALFKKEPGGQTLQVNAGETYYIQVLAEQSMRTIRAVVYPKFEGQAKLDMDSLTYATMERQSEDDSE